GPSGHSRHQPVESCGRTRTAPPAPECSFAAICDRKYNLRRYVQPTCSHGSLHDASGRHRTAGLFVGYLETRSIQTAAVAETADADPGGRHSSRPAESDVHLREY